MSKLRKVAAPSNIEQFQAQIYFDHQGTFGSKDHRISSIYNGKEVGHVEFTEASKGVLSVDECLISEKYRDYDLEEMLMDEFGKEFEANYTGWKVILNFHDPEFELAFRNLISGGLIPSSALDENNVNRNYDDQQKQQWQDLREKVPEQYRGAKRLKRKLKYS
ncbi:MAG: hypothetical protein K0R18_435 [Bacillales bacterium]|nr:hypothetical protein [Bacillales bacterium]